MTKTTTTKPEYCWDNPDVPHKGWVEERTDDRGTPSHICEMCGKEEIRYVHVMSHPNYPELLEVGEICAGNMSDDYVTSADNKRVAKNLSNNKQAWFAESTWGDGEGFNYQHVNISPWSSRNTRSIKTTAMQLKHNVWKWGVSSTNGTQATGFAYSREDAKQRIEQYVKTMQTK